MNKKYYEVLLIGGANRVTLVEQIFKILNNAIDIRFLSIEKDNGFYPISSLAKVIKGPVFGTSEFDEFLGGLLFRGNVIPVVLMDKAIKSLSRFYGKKVGDINIVISKLEGAEIALNKIKTRDFCIKENILYPTIYDEPPIGKKLIIKPIEGYGSRNIIVVDSYNPNCLSINKKNYIFQEYINGPETTHDLYITKDKKFYVISRDRLEVIGGEVNHCIVRSTEKDEYKIMEKISKSGLFWGPITVQTIRAKDGIYLIEINARMGGGVTASIFAGFPVIELFFNESIGLNLPFRKIKKIEMRRARRDFYRIIN